MNGQSLAGDAGLLSTDAGQCARSRAARIASAPSRPVSRPISIVLELARDARRWRIAWRRIDGDLAEELFVLMTMGDDRAVRETYVAGERAKTR